MNENVLLEKMQAAEKIIREKDEQIRDEKTNIELRFNGVSRAGQILQIVFVIVMAAALVYGSLFLFPFKETYGAANWSEIAAIAAGIVSCIFAILLIINCILTMTHYGSVINAKDELQKMHLELQKYLDNLENTRKRLEAGIKEKGKPAVRIGENVSGRVDAIRESVTDLEEFDIGFLKKLIQFVLYTGVTIWGIHICIMSYDTLESIYRSLFVYIYQQFGSGDVEAVTTIALGIALVVGFCLQYWAISVYMRVVFNRVEWKAMFVLVAGLATIWGVALAEGLILGLIALLIVLVIALVKLALKILAVIIGIGVLISFLGG